MMKGRRSGDAAIGAELSRRAACGLIAGAAAASMPDLGACAPAIVVSRPGAGIRYVLSDRRYPESLQFAAMLRRHGAIALEVTDGLTSLWRNALVPLWRGESGGAVAGLTRPETAACVTEQARSHARRPVLAGGHGLSARGQAVEHHLTGAPSTIADAAMLETSAQAWPLVMANLAERCLEGERRATVSGRFAERGGAAGSVASALLASWVIV